MSHHSDDAMLIVTSDSFWEPGNYKRTTKRIEDSFRLCNDLILLIQERSEIEKTYAKSLRNWSKKWNETIEKGPEYGTTEAGWKSALVEAERRCEMHLRVKDQLLNDVVTEIKQWQKDNFHKSMMHIKEKKEMDDSFKKIHKEMAVYGDEKPSYEMVAKWRSEFQAGHMSISDEPWGLVFSPCDDQHTVMELKRLKLENKCIIIQIMNEAQKPWSKLLAKVNKCKSDYHTSCKNERSAVNQERNASADTSLSPDQVKKLQDRVAKCKEEVQRSKERYEQALQEINDYNAKYMEDMTVVFQKCQEFEEKRLNFFKEMLFNIHGCLNVSADTELPQIYEEYRHTIQNADAKKDLKWWENNHGIGMAMNWPQFEDYCEEFRDIGKIKKGAVPESGITLVNQQKIGEELPEFSSDSQTMSKKDKKQLTSIDGGTLKKQSGSTQDKNKNASNRSSAVSLKKPASNPFEDDENGANKDMNGKTDQNPFEDDHEEWDEGANDALVDNGEPGVPVRALYDYEGAEDDELSFKTGDVFEKLEDEDEQGWCKGRKDGHVGLYPASYVELVPN